MRKLRWLTGWLLFYAVLAFVLLPLRLAEWVGSWAGEKAEDVMDHTFWFEQWIDEPAARNAANEIVALATDIRALLDRFEALERGRRE